MASNGQTITTKQKGAPKPRPLDKHDFTPKRPPSGSGGGRKK